MGIEVVDMNGDGELDIVFTDRFNGARSGCYWLENPGVGPLPDRAWKEHPIGVKGQNALFFGLTDLDGDGLLDVVVGTHEPKGTVPATSLYYLRRLDHAGTRWAERKIPLPADSGLVKSVTAGDINRDGKTDLVVSFVQAKDKSGVLWFRILKSWALARTWSTRAAIAAACIIISSVQGAQPPDPPPHASVGSRLVPTDVDWANPVYKTDFNDASILRDWQLEGGKRVSIQNGKLVLESEPGERGNHLVCWLKTEAPADFLLEFSVNPLTRKEGLNMVFFNTRGHQEESIFDPALKPRTGVFRQYHSSDLNGYHISYWAGDRSTANVRKNAGFKLVATGPDLVWGAPEGKFQIIRLYKRGGTLRLMVDDVVSVAFDDGDKTHGPAWTHSGWIGLRQMGHTVRCEYDYLRVYPLRDE